MTPPPINIDGTDITGATIDGQDVEQITIDGQDVLSAIPDSVVSRDPDNRSNTLSGERYGVAFRVKSDFSEIGYKISSNTSSDPTKAYLADATNDVVLKSVGITSLGSGDTFTIEADYQTGIDYTITLDAEGSGYTYGYHSSPEYPYESADIEIFADARGANGLDTSETDASYTIISIGDVGF